MKEKTVYEAFDGATFLDSATCLRYEKLVRRWEQAKERLLEPKQKQIGIIRSSLGSSNYERLMYYFDEVIWTDEGGEREMPPEVFLERMDVLQELAAFMASED